MFSYYRNSCVSSWVSINIHSLFLYEYLLNYTYYNLIFYSSILNRCTIVLYNARKNRQSHITNPSRKTFTSLDFSEDGHYLVTGECGHQPHVRVWDVHDKSMIVEFPGHKFGINCVVSLSFT